MSDGQSIVTRKVTVKVDEPVLIEHKETEETTGPIEVFHGQKVHTREVIPQGQLKKTPIVTGNPDAPVDGLAQSEKTDEQIENLKKLKDAREFMQTEEGAKLAQSMLDQQCNLSAGQRKWLKKQGIDPDAFVQEWNKAHPESANNKTHNAQAADEAKDEMGTLANTHLGVGENREGSPASDRKLPDNRNFLQKMFKTKDKQKVKADAEHGFETATKVNMHSSTAERKGDLEHAVADDMAQQGEEYLEAYTGKSDGKRRRTFKETDENGNIVKTKVVYNKDGSVKKVVTKSDTDGKLVVKQAKDGDITVRGNLKSDFYYEESPGLNERVIEDTTILNEVVTKKTKDTYLQNRTVTIHEREHCPDPVIPDPKPVTGGLIQDYVNAAHTSGRGGVQGGTIREEFRENGASVMADAYCSYTDKTAPESIKKQWPNCPGRMANEYNGKHLAECLINDAENKKVDEAALGALITELRRQGKEDALRGVKSAIIDHNNNVNPNQPDFIEGTRTVNRPVTASEMAVEWLMNNKKIEKSSI